MMRESLRHYRESCEADANRRIISIKLQVFEPVMLAKESASSGSPKMSRPAHFITRDTDRGTQIEFYEQTVAYDVPDSRKTVARLDRGKLFPVISAASGWRADFAVEHLLDIRLWRDHVLELCQLIRYSLPSDARDESTLLGSYMASHAEKKLIAYYISEHLILPSDLLKGAAVRGSREWMQQDLALQHLVPLAPRIPCVQARIRVSRATCSDCERFISHIKGVFGLSFIVEHC
jgi:hypothetical protein